MSVTKCMCFGRPLAPGNDRAWSIIYFISSCTMLYIHSYRMSFLVADACFIAGATEKM
ncbi:hypothetical protein F2Q70_00032707 [Brassica cretica]|uniref:Uncharacterized protein n=2 Tax=Brassica cretica TaxID=69181 RepID=A0A8S9H217_BRACR|nr:hypothetical protein F2Q70_00032707 [Brassica cretica]KAF2551839.1 hypothetical protein F2Q68_00037067 [Brassica cretica]KAF3498041.1 hypothetical protein DY000_02057749 [Brassica cretica]